MENRSIYYHLLAKSLKDERASVVVEIDHITLAKYKVEKKATKMLNLSTGEATPLTPLAEMGTAASRERDMAHGSELINAPLKGQNMETFANLLALLGLREYLATVDYSFPPADVSVELEPDTQHLEMKELVGHPGSPSGETGSAAARDRRGAR